MKFVGDVWHFAHAHWPLLLPVVLGFLAVYWLLPSVRRAWILPGILAGAAAILCAGWFLIQRQFMAVEGVLFYAFSGLAVLGGGLMLSQHSPVRAALSFALVVLSTCGLFLLLAAPFLMAATIIIYAGAIIITFLFVVMLAQQAGLASADTRSREPFLASLAGFVLLAGLLIVLQRNYDTRELDGVIHKVEQVLAAKSPQEIQKALGDPQQSLGNWPFPVGGSVGEDEEKVAVKALVKSHYDEVTDLVGNIEHAWRQLHASKNPDAQKVLHERCEKLLRELQEVRAGQGSLQPAAGLPLSPLSGIPANAPFPTDAKERLPARNVAALGQALFSDYLIAVELAGVLLLVATIGAIVIAGQQGPVRTPAKMGAP